MDDRHRRTGLRWRLRRTLSLGSAALTLGGGLAMFASTGAGAVVTPPSPSWSPAHGITLPAGASTTVGSQLLGVGCTPSGNYCVAGGYYATSSTSGTLPMIVTYSGGTWGTAKKVLLPSNAASVPHAEVTSVSCPTSSSCVAFGYYRYKNSGTKRNAFVAEQSASGWGRAHTLPMPKNVLLPTNAWSAKITCPSPRNCTAVGQYVDKDKDKESFAINRTASGGWVQGHWIWTPPDAPKIGKNVVPYGISCSSNTDCVLVGKYLTAAGATEPFAVNGQTTGPWSATAQRIGLPAGALTGTSQVADLHGVQCFSAGNCFAVGNYKTSGPTPAAFYSNLTSSTWDAHGTVLPAAPADAASPAKAQGNGLYCFDASDCVLVGFYTNSGGLMSPLSDAYSGGPPGWQTAVGVAPPVGNYKSANFKDVSCWGSPWTCVGVGSYVNSGGHTRPMAAEAS